MEWYKLPVNEVERKLHVFHKRGLLQTQIDERRKKYGENLMQEAERPSILVLWMKQFQDFLVLILFAATFIAAILGEYIDATAILLIVLLNGCIGFFQERKAERSLEQLKALSAPEMRVLRNGEWKTIQAKEAVIGDVVALRTGDRVPADIRLVHVNALQIDEAILTGESAPVHKQEAALTHHGEEIHNQTNMAFKSTLVRKGSGVGIIVRTGMQTEIGQVAQLLEKTTVTTTPLERKLADLGKVLIYIVLALTILTVLIGLYDGKPMYDMFLIGISLAVAVIPEGLPAIVTVTLSLGVQRMLRRKVLVRKLSSVETLGCTSVICTDKTGTITENKMVVKELYMDGQYIAFDDLLQSSLPKNISSNNVQQMLQFGALCNEASLQVKRGAYVVDGDPTDGAILIAARNYGISYVEDEKYDKVTMEPFDVLKKRMHTIVEGEDGKRYFIMKGAPEEIIPRSRYQLDTAGKKRSADNRKLQKAAEHMAEKAYRVIAIAMKEIKGSTVDENDCIFLGMYGLFDPPRKGVKKAIATCRNAGIQTVMITGDHPLTASAIAKEVGIVNDTHNEVLDGKTLEHMSDAKLQEVVSNINVFARVTPTHKLRIVEAFQAKGHIVAMTGDGVNDAPAIKQSNIGISMGITGTDVTKEASSIVLMDDNFITLQEAIKEGRNIYENIRKFIRYLLTSNVGEIILMLFAILLSYPLPLIPVQILWVNLVTDGLPAMALSMDRPEKNVMNEKPRHPNERILSRGLGWKIISRGLLIGLVSLIAFIVSYHISNDITYARTIAFSTIIVAQLIHVFDCRNERGIWTRSPFGNLYLVGAVLSSLVLLLVVLYVPFLQQIFQTVPLLKGDWGMIVLLGSIPTIVSIFTKHRKK
ncbi:cation-translocating P-type ATPase [Pseudogracilibacillus sp. ICA-222130]|uniref:cation-translocating P-type ATPase n=1 Tax=Pseudogracilibacillus sp. ICA-222130 TaxID=3134655 RepID=UPI0030C46D83